ncbi:hypothetical protein ACFPER_05100 [Agromyces aurantiacus]|uniref:Uncharacterized protein n=1 Tax=Agromyces aurantiacus TaxID=165814 RepID=A0ABV9R3Y5_9MICO|nr:hypothetical protein [Agromyces aurantiacus]MBM7502837.1 hypothetical protein [Agromyces aurantiacus]
MRDHLPARLPDDEPSSPSREHRPPGARRRLGASIHAFVTAVNLRLFTASAGIYVAAGSFVGFEALAFLLGFAPLWPIAIPILIGGIAVVGLVLNRVEARRDDER